MLKTLGPVAVFVAALVMVGSAASEEPQSNSRPCAFVNQIDNFKAIDERTAIIETSPSRRFKVTFFSTCRELKWAWSIRIDARPGICLSPGDALIVGRDSFTERCIIQTIEALPATVK